MNRSWLTSRLGVTLVCAALATAALACNGQSAAGLQVNNAWARTSPKVALAGAAYMSIANGGTTDDALTGARVDPSVAASVEIHETVAVGSDMGSGQMMDMRPVDRIAIPAGQTVTLEPGGYHIMLINLATQLEAGKQIQLTLTFEHAGDVNATADVRETAP